MNLHLELTKKLKPLSDRRFLLAVSGGLDSMVLTQIFCHFRKNFSFDFAVAHVHHGPTECNDLKKFRDSAAQHVEDFCDRNKIPFFCNLKSSSLHSLPLGSEAECRDYRYSFLQNVMHEQEFDLLVLAHHRDDLLETRLLRLLRGVGPGSLISMEFLQSQRLRPLLEFGQKDLKEYALQKELTWVEDPSNQSSQNMRNWVRNEWLPSLESKQPGASKSLARSLELMIKSTQSGQNDLDLSQILSQSSLQLSDLLALDLDARRQVIASYMKGQNLKNYGLSHVNEILKRLDTEQKSHTFRLLGRTWNVDAGRMKVQGPGQFETSR